MGNIDEVLRGLESQLAEGLWKEQFMVETEKRLLTRKGHDLTAPKTILLKDGSLTISPNGRVNFNKKRFRFNPKKATFIVLRRLSESEDYQVSYGDFLPKSNNKDSRRALTFVIRDIKRHLGILPKRKQSPRNFIINVKNWGYRLDVL